MSLRERREIIVLLDDDPTGSQTAEVPVITRWRADDLAWGIARADPALFVLTNSRAMGPGDAARTARDVARAALNAAADAGVRVRFVNRSDSTLRGHFPVEVDVLAEELTATGRRIDAVLVCPAYPEAGRITVDGTHLVRSSGRLVPVGDTDYARDASFGFTSSRLADWVVERWVGRWSRADVSSICLRTIRTGGPDAVRDALLRVLDSRPVVVDAETVSDLVIVAAGIHAAECDGHEILVHCGPTLARTRGGLPSAPTLSAGTLAARMDQDLVPHGLMVVGSHVELTTRQVDHARGLGGWQVVTLDVSDVVDRRRRPQALSALVEEAVTALRSRDVVIQTSRVVTVGRDNLDSLRVASAVARTVVGVASQVLARGRPRWVVTKGGITSSDTITKVLGLWRAQVLGPLLPGMVPLWAPAVRGGPLCVVFPGTSERTAASPKSWPCCVRQHC